MQVLLITGSYPPMKCGVGSYTKRLADALATYENVKVSVLTDQRVGEAVKHNGVKILPIIRHWRLREFFQIAKLIKRLKPNIVHIQYPTQGYSGRLSVYLPLLLRLIGVSCVQTWHEPIPGLAGIKQSIGLKSLIMVKKELMTHVPCLTQMALFNTRLFWIPCASLLPLVSLSDQECMEIRSRYISTDELLLVYYGFVAPLKGIETIFEIVKKTGATLLMVCDFQSKNHYHSLLLNLIVSMKIESQVIIVGFLPDQQLAAIIVASDAVVLPFRDGAKDWNTSVSAAALQGTFVLTTSVIDNGYKNETNIYYANLGNSKEMVAAIKKYAGHHIPCKSSTSAWQKIAKQHISIYKSHI